MPKFDVTKVNVAVDHTLDSTVIFKKLVNQKEHTIENCAKLLEPLILPLHSFDELVLRKRSAAAD